MSKENNEANRKLNKKAWLTTVEISLFVTLCNIGSSLVIYRSLEYVLKPVFFLKEFICILPYTLALACLSFGLMRKNFAGAFDDILYKKSRKNRRNYKLSEEKNAASDDSDANNSGIKKSDMKAVATESGITFFDDAKTKEWEASQFVGQETGNRISDSEAVEAKREQVLNELRKTSRESEKIMEEIDSSNNINSNLSISEYGIRPLGYGDEDSDKDYPSDSKKDFLIESEEDTSDEAMLRKLEKIEEINTEKGLEYAGSLDLYLKIIKEFVTTGASRAETIENLYNSRDYRNYTIQVHALKSAARVAGATKVSMLAAALEEAGNEENETKINNATTELLRIYRSVVEKLGEVVIVKKDLPMIDEESLNDALMAISEMAEGFDFDGVDSVMQELGKYSMPQSFEEKYEKLKTLVAEVARDDILFLIKNM